jgi:chorismate-pyruvate lyase
MLSYSSLEERRHEWFKTGKIAFGEMLSYSSLEERRHEG